MENEQILEAFGFNANILARAAIANNKIQRYSKILCGISGGSDSDIMLDMLHALDADKKITYVFFNTGIEYQATKDHLDYLEEKYSIEIVRRNAKKVVPVSCAQYGIPFFSKRVSEMMERLQRHGFKWEDEPFDVLIEKYPRCRSALKFWCNKHGKDGDDGESSFNIERNYLLKEFIIANPPDFSISCKCCDYAKKLLALDFDGTLFANAYPEIGAPMHRVIEYVKALKAAGNIIILWTCRCDKYLEAAIAACQSQGLTFDLVNENAACNIRRFGNNPRKINADLYIDDKAINVKEVLENE